MELACVCSRRLVCYFHSWKITAAWVSEGTGKPCYVQSADKNVGGSVGVYFVLFSGFDIFVVVSYGGWEAGAGEFAAFYKKLKNVSCEHDRLKG